MLNMLGSSRGWMFAAVLLMAVGRAEAQSVTLAWDPNSEPDLAGYIIGYGTTPGQNHATVDVGMTTQWTLSGFNSGQTYYFRVYAYNSLGMRSAPSVEVSTTMGGGGSGSGGTGGTGGCIGMAPGAGWVCINGGWVPPDSPLVTGGAGVPAPAPAPMPEPVATGCPGSAPGAGWVCLNGGWLPPDSPALWTAPASSCPGTAPGVMWQCVNGGWVPPTSPTPTSPSTAPSAIPCPGSAPGLNWVCLNGGWLPPDSPALVGWTPTAPAPTAPAQPPAPTACVGSSPGLGWLCINGGWVPPDHPLARGGGTN